MTWEAMPVNKLPAPLTPIAEESTEPGGGEIIDEEEEEAQLAEVWPLAGRGLPHVRLDTFNAGGATGTEAEGEGNGAAQQQSTDDVESEDSGEDDCLIPVDASTPPSSPRSSSSSNDSDDNSSDSSPSSTDELPDATRRALRQLGPHMTDAHDGDEIREGRTRAQSRARNQQEAVGLLCDLGPVAGHQILRALIAEKGTRSMLEPCDLPTELIQDADPEPNTYAEANASQYAELWRRAMSDEFQGLLAAGTFALSGLVPEGNKILTARWIFK